MWNLSVMEAGKWVVVGTYATQNAANLSLRAWKQNTPSACLLVSEAGRRVWN